MHVLTVFTPIQRKSFPGLVLDHFVEGIVEAVHTAEVADLHAEDFDPRFGHVPAQSTEWIYIDEYPLLNK